MQEVSPVIREIDLDEAIAECVGKRNPDAQTCIKLAAYYTIKQHLYPSKIPSDDQQVLLPEPSYSYSSGNDTGNVEYESDTAFGKAVYGIENSQIWPLIDELVETVRVVNTRLYDAFLRKINAL